MISITTRAQQEMLQIIKKMEKGDNIKFDGITFFIYNSQGCLIDYIDAFE